jgi:HEAT repeat protein
MPKRLIAVIGVAIVLAVCCVVSVAWIAPRSPFVAGFIEHQFGHVIPASSFARNLDSDDNDLVRESLHFLTERKDPIAVPKAIALLQSTDDYVWLNAALYLGACKRSEEVPYLIKALRHTAWHSDSETAQYLRDVTGKDFGGDFSRWQHWWIASHPESKLDWESHLGPIPRVPNMRSK